MSIILVKILVTDYITHLSYHPSLFKNSFFEKRLKIQRKAPVLKSVFHEVGGPNFDSVANAFQWFYLSFLLQPLCEVLQTC